MSDWYEREVAPLLRPDAVYPPEAIRKKQGRYLRGQCPFPGCEGDSLSFSVSVENLGFKCFRCDRTGDAPAFIAGGEAPRGRNYLEAVRKAAALAGVNVPDSFRERSPRRPPDPATARPAATTARKPGQARTRATKKAETSRTAPLAQEMWTAGVSPNETPAHAYLASRRVWPPPRALRELPDSPRRIRWLPRPAFNPERLSGCPADAVGLVLFGFTPVGGGPVAAVQTEALTVEGVRFGKASRFRKAYGPRSGLVFEAAAGSPGCPTVLCEGPVTALASRWLHPDCRVLACGGTSGLPEIAEALAKTGCRLILEADGGNAGRKAARRVQAAVPPGTVEIRGWNRRDKKDAADDFAETIEDEVMERATIMEFEGGLTRIEAERKVWRGYLDRRDGHN